MRPIAMRCNQEQFDSIKDRINLPISESVFRFSGLRDSYLTNDYNGAGEVKYTLSPECHKEIHETFNADIFLEACGVEVEKVWESSEMEFLSKLGVWSDFAYDFKVRLKPQPNYQKEIEALQQKAKAKENGMKVIINFEKC